MRFESYLNEKTPHRLGKVIIRNRQILNLKRDTTDFGENN